MSSGRTCRECQRARCMCDARRIIVAVAREIDAAYEVVESARASIAARIARDGKLYESEDFVLRDKIDALDRIKKGREA